MRLWGWWRCRHEGRILISNGLCLDCREYVPVALAEINAMVLPPPLLRFSEAEVDGSTTS